MIDIRCSNCQKKLCEANPEAKIKAVCPRCKTPFKTFQGEIDNDLVEK